MRKGSFGERNDGKVQGRHGSRSGGIKKHKFYCHAVICHMQQNKQPQESQNRLGCPTVVSAVQNS